MKSGSSLYCLLRRQEIMKIIFVASMAMMNAILTVARRQHDKLVF